MVFTVGKVIIFTFFFRFMFACFQRIVRVYISRDIAILNQGAVMTSLLSNETVSPSVIILEPKQLLRTICHLQVHKIAAELFLN